MPDPTPTVVTPVSLEMAVRVEEPTPVLVEQDEAQGFAYDIEVVEVKNHRRVHKHQRGRCIAAITAEIKSKMGTPQVSGANTLAIRHLAFNRCKELKIRPKHAREIIELVIAAVYVPDKVDADRVTFENSRATRAKYARVSYVTKSWLYKKFMSERAHAMFGSVHSSGPSSA